MLEDLVIQYSFMCCIMPYYGYLHECAELYSKLCKHSRYQFQLKSYGIITDAMKHKKSKCKLEFNQVFTSKQANFLYKRNFGKLFSLGICLESSISIKASMNCISNSWPAQSCFYSVVIRYHPSFHQDLQNFLTLFIGLGHDTDAIEIIDREKMKKSSVFIDILGSATPLAKNNLCQQCNIFLLTKSDDPIKILKTLKFKVLLTTSSFISKIKEKIELEKNSEEKKTNIALNSKSCNIVQIKDLIDNEDSNKNLKYVLSWLCANFQKLNSIQMEYDNKISFEILKCLLCEKNNQENICISQIINIACDNRFRVNDSWMVSLNLSNIQFYFASDQMIQDYNKDLDKDMKDHTSNLSKNIVLRCDNLSISCQQRNCILIESPFEDDTCNYLLIKNEDVNFKLEGVRIDKNCPQFIQNKYSLLMQEYMQDDNNEVLFIIPIKDFLLPKYFNVDCYDLQTCIDNHRLKHHLTIKKFTSLKELEQTVNNLSKKCLLCVTIKDTVDLNFPKEQVSIFNSTEDNHESNLERMKRIWISLLSRNIYDLRIEPVLEDNWLLDMVLEFCSTENEKSPGRNINDLDLNLSNHEGPRKFLRALDKNYTIKTCRLFTKVSLGRCKKFGEEVEEFRNKRVATEIVLNSGIQRFRDPSLKCFEIFYPDCE